MNFGNNLKKLRKESNMSQEDLAYKIGVTRQSVSKWETGEAYPEMSNIVCLCKIFRCEITDLINDNIIDTEQFDKETKDQVIKFKKNQQSNMKRISKAIYIVANICKITLAIPTVILLLATLLFPFFSGHFDMTDKYISFYDQKIEFSIDNNVITVGGEKTYINTKTNLETFIKTHDKKYFVLCIEYVLFSVSLLTLFIVIFLHLLYKLYKNINMHNTPFTLNNEKIVNKAVLMYVIYFVFMKLSALLFMLVTHIDLSIDFNIKDVIEILVIVSLVYLFKYGRMIQIDSKAQIYE